MCAFHGSHELAVFAIEGGAPLEQFVYALGALLDQYECGFAIYESVACGYGVFEMQRDVFFAALRPAMPAPITRKST